MMCERVSVHLFSRHVFQMFPVFPVRFIAVIRGFLIPFSQLDMQPENIGSKLDAVSKKVAQVGHQLTTKVTMSIVAPAAVCMKTFTSFADSLTEVPDSVYLIETSANDFQV